MIKDKIDFDYSYQQILNKIDTDIKQQEILLDSTLLNDSFKKVEKNLNILYEKSRYLEGMIKYCKAFLSIKIDEYSTEAKSILNLIEDIRDINKNMSYIDYPVLIDKPTHTLKDRDDSILYPSIIQNDLLVIGNEIEDYITPTSASKKCTSIPYKDNFNEILNGHYNTTYIERNLIKGGITERITINFKHPITMNTLNIKTSNAEVSNISYKFINGIEEVQEKLDSGFSRDRTIVRLSFDLTCKNYNHSKYKINKEKLTDNTWNRIKDFEYNFINNINTKIEMEEVVDIIRNNSATYNSKDELENIIEQDIYTYVFGIDNIDIKYVKPYNSSCFLSKDINIGTIKEGEYITLYSDYNIYAESGIEFSIIDGDIEIPIIPSNHNKVVGEKIFKQRDLRFDNDSEKEMSIKHNGLNTNTSLDDAKLLSTRHDIYSAEYYSLDNKGFSYSPLNRNIRIKAVLRRYNKAGEMPYIKNIKIRKFGGSSTWIEAL